ncbi:unnamed protein product, partial [Symbiodinium pilosum]
PPVASDVLLLLVGETWDRTQVALKCDASVDGLGDIAVSLGHYDPFLYSSLRLVVMPVLPDKAFKVRWAQEGLEVAESELEKLGFAELTRCHQSVFLQERYRVCGAGLLEDLPVAIALSPWSRAPQPRSFEAVLRAGPPWPATPRKLKIDHGAVD